MGQGGCGVPWEPIFCGADNGLVLGWNCGGQMGSAEAAPSEMRPFPASQAGQDGLR